MSRGRRTSNRCEAGGEEAYRPSPASWGGTLPMKPLLAGVVVLVVALVVPLAAVGVSRGQDAPKAEKGRAGAKDRGRDADKDEPKSLRKSDEEWAQVLTPAQFLVTRRKATEPPFSGRYVGYHGKGTFACVCCGTALFDARTKFESGTGWPSF